MINGDSNRTKWGMMFLSVIIIALLLALLVSPSNSPPSTPSPTITPSSTPTTTPSPALTETPSPTATPAPPSPAEVRFYNIDYYVPEDEGYPAGFKIDSESFDRAFNQIYSRNYTGGFFNHFDIGQGDVYAEVRAECWDGGLSQRPADPEKRVGLSQEIRRGRDTYVIGEVPPRVNVSSDEYACLFAFQNSSLDIFSASNESGLPVIVRKQIEVSRGELQNKPHATTVSEPFSKFPASDNPLQSYHESHCKSTPRPESCSDPSSL